MKFKRILPVILSIFALLAAALPVRADDTLANEMRPLLRDYWVKNATTQVVCTNINPSANNIAGASWAFGRAQLETIQLTIVGTNAATADVNVIIGPTVTGTNVDSTVNFFKFKATLNGTTPVTVVTNIPSALLGGARWGVVYSVQNAHTAYVKVNCTRTGWNK